MPGGIVMNDDLDEEKSNLNNHETNINRGVELLLRNRRNKPDPPKTFQVKFGKMISFFRKRDCFSLKLLSGHQKEIISGVKNMLAVALTIGTLVSIMFFFVGGVIGWLARENTWVNQPIYTHPEMFDENGNVLPDEILAVRFENGYDELDETDDD